MTLTKRPAEQSLDMPSKKASPSTSSAPKVQTSLLGWAKPKVTAVSVSATTEQGSTPTTVVNAAGAGASSSSPSPSSFLPLAKARPDILKGLSDEMRDLLRLEQDTMDATWLRALQMEFSKPYFIALKKFLKQEEASRQQVFPPKGDIYSWSRFTPLPSVRVVILGQDPYHDDNQAHGLCFSVKKPVRPPPSLKNMFKLLETDIPGFKTPDHGYLESWARQGVLMVNASMTVRAHAANSHKGKGWEKLLDAVIKTVSDQRKNVVFLLWGKDAQNKAVMIDRKKHLVLMSVHPSPLSCHRGYFDCQHYSKANKYLADNGLAPINWNSLIDDTS
ncbi:uracil-DNA glycosylase [Entomortierella parvispora]|uniref:Uracil-DNA glycosylase n=1 Tax=Entomortierella parvispora TaxID=205924 RepID=A0A9P3H303_9FUNG|nr:uracil-DNA glycosylase [Entomortierella parvispora]